MHFITENSVQVQVCQKLCYRQTNNKHKHVFMPLWSLTPNFLLLAAAIM